MRIDLCPSRVNRADLLRVPVPLVRGRGRWCWSIAGRGTWYLKSPESAVSWSSRRVPAVEYAITPAWLGWILHASWFGNSLIRPVSCPEQPI